MSENNLGIRVVVASNRKHFYEICRMLGIAVHSVKYVKIDSNLENYLAGYYREDIYPEQYGELRPTKQTLWISKEDHDNL